MLRGISADEIRQIAVCWDLVQGRKAELAQDCCSSLAPVPRRCVLHRLRSMIRQVGTGLPGRYPPVLLLV
ncbi:hypothetical protein LIU39_25425 [Streptomyces sp. SF28]|nr:hypothetical protein [Streptomyces pinistramenti]